MRSIQAFAIVFACAALQPIEVTAKPVQQEFAQAWTDRAARYDEQQKALNQRVEASLQELHEASQAKSPGAKQKTDQFLAALQDGAYMHGRIGLLKELQAHMARKPSAAATELWVQEQTDALRMQADALDKLGERLGADESSEGVKAKMSALASSAEFFGRLAELSLVDQNLNTFFKAKTARDESRRRARAAFFGALATAFQNNSGSTWTATCVNSPLGFSTTCTGN